MAENGAKRLLRLLRAEQAAITGGVFEDLPALCAEKEELFAAVSTADLPRDTVNRLAAATARNQRLLEAALQGMRAAEHTLDTLNKAQKGSNVYGSDGKMSRLSKGGQRVSQKL